MLYSRLSTHAVLAIVLDLTYPNTCCKHITAVILIQAQTHSVNAAVPPLQAVFTEKYLLISSLVLAHIKASFALTTVSIT